jgi:hypothetical protein
MGISRSASRAVSDNPAKAQRREARFAADFPVRVVWSDLSHAGPGQIKDVSPGGARVVMAEAAAAPGHVYLLVHPPGEAGPQRLAGEVRWQVGAVIGVRFDPPLRIEMVRTLAAAPGVRPGEAKPS